MLVTLAAGTVLAREIRKRCRPCRSAPPAVSRELAGLVPPGQRYGYDLIAWVGLARYHRHLQREEIRAALDRQGIALSSGSVSALGDRFLAALEALHWRQAPALRASMPRGYALHIDATCDKGRGDTFRCLDGWTGWTLHAVRIWCSQSLKQPAGSAADFVKMRWVAARKVFVRLACAGPRAARQDPACLINTDDCREVDRAGLCGPRLQLLQPLMPMKSLRFRVRKPGASAFAHAAIAKPNSRDPGRSNRRYQSAPAIDSRGRRATLPPSRRRSLVTRGRAAPPAPYDGALPRASEWGFPRWIRAIQRSVPNELLGGSAEHRRVFTGRLPRSCLSPLAAPRCTLCSNRSRRPG